MYLDELNQAQRAAVEYLNGPELVIAGAGSGKTRVLTYKVVHLLNQGIDPGRIMALTFTNKAAREMKERVAGMVDSRLANRLWMGTFHSIFLRILRKHADLIGFRHDFTIYDASDSKSLIKAIIKELGLNDKQYKPSTIASVISSAKNSLITPQMYRRDSDFAQMDLACNRPLTGRIYAIYAERCRIAQAMDFDDILLFMNILLRDNPEVLEHYSEFFAYILVDEYQDTNFAQNLVVTQLAKAHGHICMVGDDAQSIYSFRGADINNILKLKNRFPTLEIFKLERNYRSTQTIVNAAGTLIAKNHGQIPKKIFSENELGEPIEIIEAYNEYEEAAMVAADLSRQCRRNGANLNEVAILYRTNAQSRALEEALRRNGTPYRIYGGITFYQRKEVKDAVCYLRLVVNSADDEALRRIINFPARGIGETTMKKVQAAATDHGVPMFEVCADPAAYDLEVNRGTVAKLTSFANIINELRADKEAMTNVFALGQSVYNSTGLLMEYSHDTTPENISKYENLLELLNGMKEFVDTKGEVSQLGMPSDASPAAFLSEVSLLTDQDANADADTPKVTLMTVHASKGLEFPYVYITGLEDTLFPSSQSMDSPLSMEEERRLLYVAITRAGKVCKISHARMRFRNGRTEMATPSRFLKEISSRYTLNRHLNSFSPEASTTTTFEVDGMRISAIEQPKEAGTEERRLFRVPIDRARLQRVARTTAGSNKPSLSLLYNVGDRVAHDKFGKGTVVEVSSDGDARLRVDFDNVGIKILLLRFAKLRKLTDND